MDARIFKGCGGRVRPKLKCEAEVLWGGVPNSKFSGVHYIE